MGRKTFCEIGHALPYCTIVIISKTMKDCPPGCELFTSLKKAVKAIAKDEKKQNPGKIPEILICGGESIYRQTIKKADIIYATEIHADFSGDTFFPELNKHWKKISTEQKEENGIRYDYITYKRF